MNELRRRLAHLYYDVHQTDSSKLGCKPKVHLWVIFISFVAVSQPQILDRGLLYVEIKIEKKGVELTLFKYLYLVIHQYNAAIFPNLGLAHIGTKKN